MNLERGYCFRCGKHRKLDKYNHYRGDRVVKVELCRRCAQGAKAAIHNHQEQTR